MGFDGPVKLKRSALAAFSGQLLFCDVVDSTAIARSAVLSCIVEAGGEAVLPDSITLAEFKTWLKEGNRTVAEAKKWTFSLLCTVMKVADVLDDGRVGEWVKLAADSLLPETACLAGDASPDEASHSLSHLPDSLRRRVFAAAAVSPACLHRVLDVLPSRDHAAVLEATIKETMTLNAPLRESLKVLKALPSIPASPPSFLSLDVHDLNFKEPITPESPAAELATTCLVQALQHHTGLTSLRMKLACITSTALKQLAPAIASLASLQYLLLHSSIGPDSLPTLQQTFHALPHLQRLVISISSYGTRKRQRDDDGASAPMHSLMPMLSAATGLTSLDLSTVAVGDSECRVKAESTIEMPQLRRLVLDCGNSQMLSCASILANLRAPLTSLDILHDNDLELPADFVELVQMLFPMLASFTELQSLALATPWDDDSGDFMQRMRERIPTMSAEQGMSINPASLFELMRQCRTPAPQPPHRRTRVILDAVSSGVPTTLEALPRLTSLNISTDVSVMHLAAPVMATALTQLTALTATLSRWDSERGNWRPTLEQLARLRLQRLKVMLNGCSSVGFPGFAAMPAMPHLTALSLGAWTCVARSEDCVALGRMTQLRQLHLLGMRLPLAVRRDCARCLGALPALTSLLFHSATAGGCISGFLDEHVPEGALPALQELGLDIWGRFDRNAAEGEDEEEDEEDEAGDQGQEADEVEEEGAPVEEEVGEEEAGEEAVGHGESAAIHTMTSVRDFANRLPALVHLDLLLRDDGSAGPGVDRSELLRDDDRETARGLEVSQFGELPF